MVQVKRFLVILCGSRIKFYEDEKEALNCAKTEGQGMYRFVVVYDLKTNERIYEWYY